MRWQEAAKRESRTLGNYIRLHVNAAVRRDLGDMAR